MPSLQPSLKKKGVKSGGAPASPLAREKKGKTPETPSSNTRSRGGAAKKQNEELSTARRSAAPAPGKKTNKKKKTQLKTMLAVREEEEDGEVQSPPLTKKKKTSSKTVEAPAGVCKYGCTCSKCVDKDDIGDAELAACRQDGLSLEYCASAGILLPGQIPKPQTIAAAAGSSAYRKAYGDADAEASGTRIAGDAVLSEEEVDLMDGIVVISRKGVSDANAASNDMVDGVESALEEEAMVDGVESALDDSDDSKCDTYFSSAEGFDFSDDEAVLDLHIDSDDEMRSSFPKDSRPKNMVAGGPQRPDPTGLSQGEYEKQLNKYKKERKKYTDKKRNESAKEAQSDGGKPGKKYTGCCNEQLRYIHDVDHWRLV